MQQLQNDIKSGNFKQAYLLYGEEAYLRRQYRDRLRSALVPTGDTMNYHYFEGKNINPLELIDLAETMPFLAEWRVIFVENSGFFKKPQEKLAEYLKEPASSVRFVFVETEVDKRSRMYKTVKDIGRAVEFGGQNEAVLKKWILVLLKKEGKRITEQGLQYFLQKVGTDMENICRELEKLFSYTLGREGITESDIDAVCVRQVSNQIFDMVEAIALRRQERALALYYDLLSLKEPPMLLQVKELKKKGYDDKRIGEKTGLHGFIVKKYVSQASRFAKEELREALTACVEADEAVKTGRMNDVMSVELLIVRYSQAAQKSKTPLQATGYQACNAAEQRGV